MSAPPEAVTVGNETTSATICSGTVAPSTDSGTTDPICWLLAFEGPGRDSRDRLHPSRVRKQHHLHRDVLVRVGPVDALRDGRRVARGEDERSRRPVARVGPSVGATTSLGGKSIGSGVVNCCVQRASDTPLRVRASVGRLCSGCPNVSVIRPPQRVKRLAAAEGHGEHVPPPVRDQRPVFDLEGGPGPVEDGQRHHDRPELAASPLAAVPVVAACFADNDVAAGPSAAVSRMVLELAPGWGPAARPRPARRTA